MEICCCCRYYRVGALELAGYVGCRRNRISLRESAPRFGPGGVLANYATTWSHSTEGTEG